jgi:two-component system, LytTR family, sensor kinase
VALRLLLLLLAWSVPGLISASQLRLVANPDVSFARAILWHVPPWWVWAAATPVICELGRRFPLDGGHLPRRVPVHLAASLAIGAAQVAGFILLGRLAGQPGFEHPFVTLWWKLGIKNLLLALVLYGGVLGAWHATEYRRRFRERALVAVRLEAQLVQAQLDALKMQLHPHFLFNALHTVAVLVRKQDSRGAVKTITALAELLRVALDSVGRQLVRLEDELFFVDRYLAIEQVRFQDRLRVVRTVAPGLLDAEIPNLLLQPLVENAIRHGISASSTAGELAITARREGDRLVVTISDDGPGLDGEGRTGVGLASVRARLAQLYGGAAALRLEPSSSGGVSATIEVPYRRV